MTRREVETRDYAAMVARIVRAHGRRVAGADPEDLADLREIHRVVDDAIEVAVAGLRDRHSWGEIAQALGISRQTAWERWRDVPKRGDGEEAREGVG